MRNQQGNTLSKTRKHLTKKTDLTKVTVGRLPAVLGIVNAMLQVLQWAH